MTEENTSLGNQVLPTGVETPRVWKLTQGPHIKTHTVTDLCGEVWNLPEVYIIEIVWKNAAYAGDGKKSQSKLVLIVLNQEQWHLYIQYICLCDQISNKK